jgi:hypothetical protein
MYTIISTPFHHQRNNSLFVLALHVSTTIGHLQMLQILCITITDVYVYILMYVCMTI